MPEIQDKRLKELEKAEAKLQALENAGVHNWQFYEDALKDFLQAELKEELLNELVMNIEDVFCEAEVQEPAGRGCGYSISINEYQRNLLRKYIVNYRNVFNNLED